MDNTETVLYSWYGVVAQNQDYSVLPKAVIRENKTVERTFKLSFEEYIEIH